jgi:hypothetical protein
VAVPAIAGARGTGYMTHPGHLEGAPWPPPVVGTRWSSAERRHVCPPPAPLPPLLGAPCPRAHHQSQQDEAKPATGQDMLPAPRGSRLAACGCWLLVGLCAGGFTDWGVAWACAQQPHQHPPGSPHALLGASRKTETSSRRRDSLRCSRSRDRRPAPVPAVSRSGIKPRSSEVPPLLVLLVDVKCGSKVLHC